MRADVDRLVELERGAATNWPEVQELNRQANEVLQEYRQGQRRRGTRRPQGRRTRASRAKRRCPGRARSVGTGDSGVCREPFPNLSHPQAPVGANDQSNLEVKQGVTPVREFDFKPLDHVELAEQHDLVDFEGGARTDGTRLLLSEERRRAAGPGAAAVRDPQADRRRVSRRRSRPTWLRTKFWKASASFPAARKRRFIASRIPI